MNFPDKGKLLNIGKGSIATLALFLTGIALPPVGAFAPLPSMYYALKSGKSVGIAVVLITTTLLAIVANPMLLLIYLAQSGLISLSIPHFLSKGWGAGRAIAFSVVVAFAFLLLVAAFFWLVQDIDPHAEVLKEISTWIPQMTAFYEKIGYKGEELQTLQQMAKETGALIARIYPAVVLTGLGVIACLNLQALRNMAARFSLTLPVGDLKKFSNPEHLIWFVIVPGFALLISNPNVTTAAMNVLVVVLALYFMQGLAVALHLFDRFVIPRYIRIIFYFLLALQPYLVVALATLGIFDLWGNFRAPKQQKNL
jgi:hypothetical protein